MRSGVTIANQYSTRSVLTAGMMSSVHEAATNNICVRNEKVANLQQEKLKQLKLD